MTDLLDRSLGPTILVTSEFPDDLPAVRTDTAQLETAILNLVVNARDAMPDGGTIRIAARHEARADRPGNYVVLRVVDEGEGMDEATLAKATEPFFTTKGVGKGTGLGLSMVHGLVEQSGGFLELSSARGRGTTAAIWLPVTLDEAKRRWPPSRRSMHGRACGYWRWMTMRWCCSTPWRCWKSSAIP